MESSEGHHYYSETYFEKMVADYANISLFEVEDIDYLDYLALRRDAFIYYMSRTESGNEYLDNAWRLEQTKPERDKLRERFGSKDGENG